MITMLARRILAPVSFRLAPPGEEVIDIELWDSILDYFFINHTLRPGTLARRSPFRSSRQPTELLSEVDSLHRITSVQLLLDAAAAGSFYWS